jgi:hypothetical protein
MRRFVCVVVVVLLIAASGFAGSLKILWDPINNDNIAGYRVHWGVITRTYPFHADAGKASQFEIENVREGIRYFCAVTSIDDWGNESIYSPEVSMVIGEDSPHTLPTVWNLQPGYPNPFRLGETSNVELAVPEAGFFTLTVYNVLGQKIRTLHEGSLSAGKYLFFWDGRDDARQLLPTAAYFYRLHAGQLFLTKSISLVH